MTKTQKLLAVPAIGSLVLAGAALGSFGLAFAQSNETATSGITAVQGAPQRERHGGPHTANGKTEEVLTGDTAARVTTAALAAQPGATIDRVETDADGATYEAHMTKADGTRITVLFDEGFSVTGTEDGPKGRNNR